MERFNLPAHSVTRTGQVTVHFGGCGDDRPNCLPIMVSQIEICDRARRFISFRKF